MTPSAPLENTALNQIRLDTSDLKQIMNLGRRFRLDFDDACQYTTADKHNLILVSFDSDFDRTQRGRKTPGDVLREVIAEQA